jgi:Flp pilus assembly protein TadD
MILAGCDKVSPRDPRVFLLHGLYARKKTVPNAYQEAIGWFEKGVKIAPLDTSLALELAFTYELTKNLTKAEQTYQQVLANNPQNRGALLGLARVYRLQSQFNKAIALYDSILTTSPHDVDALNGLGWVNAAENKSNESRGYFEKTLTIQPENQEALLALNRIKQSGFQQAGVAALCNSTRGLILLNQDNPPFAELKAILRQCETNHIDTTETALLHGLMARKEKQSNEAIFWLKKAMATAAKDNHTPALELATTYEWAEKPKEAKAIYQSILTLEPANRAALLGKARSLKNQANYTDAFLIYQQFLAKNPNDLDALNGLGWLLLAEKNFSAASQYFGKTLKIQPANKEALIAIHQIKAARLNPVALSSPCKAQAGLKLLAGNTPTPKAQIEAILQHCDKEKIETPEVDLLRGLLARKEALQNKQFDRALFWLKKALALAPKTNPTPALELATTYLWAGQPKNAQPLYAQLLAEDKTNRAALLGQATMWRMLSDFQKAERIYQDLLRKNTRDVEAMNGLGTVEWAKNNLPQALAFFRKTLGVDPVNKEALLAIERIAFIKAHPAAPLKPSLCDADKGLILLNQNPQAIGQIQSILLRCDKNTPNDPSNLMLHGLLARQAKQYPEAIAWLLHAMQEDKTGLHLPALELAVTYEWAALPEQALRIYAHVLSQKPGYRPALLGKARVLVTLNQIPLALSIYHQMLQNAPQDLEALNGLGSAFLTDFKLKEARAVFNTALAINSHNKNTLANIRVLNHTTKHMLSVTKGTYTVPPKKSEGVNLLYFENINATDGFTVFATHNTAQIESGFAAGPSLLPNNSLLLGYQHIVPLRYGWQVFYDGRQHNKLPFENRTFAAVNLYLNKRIEWFGSMRLAFPRPWNTQLFISGLTAHTPVPVNVTLTGFWSFQQIGGYTSSYALDFNKEFPNRLFYDFGTSFLPQQKSWEIHGRCILPTFRNQALVVEYSHYLFNKSTFVNAGWRVYWA